MISAFDNSATIGKKIANLIVGLCKPIYSNNSKNSYNNNNNKNN